MVHQERLEIGEKCFVSGIMAVLATEAGLTVITTGMHFSWLGLLLGITGFCLILLLANRLYAGSQQAKMIALGWIAFQILYAACALYLLVSSAQGPETAKQIGAPAVWPVLLKALVYVFLGWVLVRMPMVRDFFAERRGEIRPHDLPAQTAVIPEPGPALAFTAAQNEAARSLAQFIRLTVGGLITLGVLQILAVVFGLRSTNGQGALVLVQGLLTVVLGLALGAPSNEIRPLASQEAQTKGQLMNALSSLVKFYKLQVVVGLLLGAVTVARFVTTL